MFFSRSDGRRIRSLPAMQKIMPYIMRTRTCLLYTSTVFSVLDYRILLGAVLVALLLFDRPVLRQVDYALLGTFLCFFLFSGNLSRIPAVRDPVSYTHLDVYKRQAPGRRR